MPREGHGGCRAHCLVGGCPRWLEGLGSPVPGLGVMGDVAGGGGAAVPDAVSSNWGSCEMMACGSRRSCVSGKGTACARTWGVKPEGSLGVLRAGSVLSWGRVPGSEWEQDLVFHASGGHRLCEGDWKDFSILGLGLHF